MVFDIIIKVISKNSSKVKPWAAEYYPSIHFGMFRVLYVASLLVAVPSEGFEMAVTSQGVSRKAQKSTTDVEDAATSQNQRRRGDV